MLFWDLIRGGGPSLSATEATLDAQSRGPLIILFHPGYSKNLKGVMVAAFLVVIGIFGERFSLVVPGTAYPLPLYPGKIEGIWGMAGSFPITPVVTFMSLGILTLVGLLFLVGLKNLELLPIAPPSAQGVEGTQPSPETVDKA